MGEASLARLIAALDNFASQDKRDAGAICSCKIRSIHQGGIAVYQLSCRSWDSLGSYWQKTRFICGLLWAGVSVTGKEMEEIMQSLTEVRQVDTGTKTFLQRCWGKDSDMHDAIFQRNLYD